MYRWVLLTILLTTQVLFARTSPYIPPPMQSWKDWVLDTHHDIDCPVTQPASQKYCAWPGVLNLDLENEGGNFRQSWVVFGESDIPLPGETRHWPTEVQANGKALVVVDIDGVPHLHLTPGEYTIEGRMQWHALPERLKLPDASLLLDLKINGLAVHKPFRKEGALLVHEKAASTPSSKDTLALRVSRLMQDGQPLEVTTRLDLQITGQPREVYLGNPLLEGFAPFALSGNLSARIDGSGRLTVLAKPGHFVLLLKSYARQPLTHFAMPNNPLPWPKEETWAFAANPSVRTVEIGGLASLDPEQTQLPVNWKQYPAYAVSSDKALVLKPIRQGEKTPPEDGVTLRRAAWLDFSGDQFTVQDHIDADLHRRWRLHTLPAIGLGRVSVNGQDRFITKLPGDPRPGIEVRHGRLALVAESRTSATGVLPVSGWDLSFQKVTSDVRLPPGWKLMATEGVDRENASWLQQWTIYDLFLLFVIAFGSGKLWGWGWTPVALLALGLIWQESYVLHGIWLYLLILTAVRRVLPSESRLTRMVRFLWLGGAIVLSVATLEYAVTQGRAIIYPQLEPHNLVVTPASSALVENRMLRLQEDKQGVPALAQAKVAGRKLTSIVPPPSDYWVPDPNARVQTGPGMPQWAWRSIHLEWDGPVGPSESFRLHLLPPAGTRLYRLAGLLMLGLLFWRFVAGGPFIKLSLPGKWTAMASMLSGLGIAALMTTVFAPATAWAEDSADVNVKPHKTPTTIQSQAFPPPELLVELEHRLTKQPQCLPHCVSIPEMKLIATGERIEIVIQIHALARVGIPIPQGDYSLVQAKEDNEPAALQERDGRWWLLVKKGIHTYHLAGYLANHASVILSLPLLPKYVMTETEGWQALGIDPWGVPSRQIILQRTKSLAQRDQDKQEEKSILSSLVRLTRTFVFDKEWQVRYSLQRLSPGQEAISLSLPLLPGEKVLDDRLLQTNDAIRAALPAGVVHMEWQSRLPIAQRWTINAPDIKGMVETWRFEISPNWHPTITGFNPVHQQAGGRVLPTYLPWPGTSLSLEFVRPEGINGRVFTLRAAKLNSRPGREITESTLHLDIRASRGIDHDITLPQDATLIAFQQDGKSQPLGQKDNAIRLRLHPGEQSIDLTWRQPTGTTTVWHPDSPELAAPAVNAENQVRLSRDRWVLFVHGPALGPAVLFWGVAGVVLAVALVLGRFVRITPLGVLSWLFLGLGLLQSSAIDTVLVVAMLLALGMRQKLKTEHLTPWSFDLIQVGLLALLAIGLYSLFAVIKQGLTGYPDMWVTGHGSNAHNLLWYQDRINNHLPSITVVSVPIWIYRSLMLAWALWLAFSVVRWSRWGWESFSQGGSWKKFNPLLLKNTVKHSGGKQQTNRAKPPDTK